VAPLKDQTGDILKNILLAKPDVLLIAMNLGDCNGLDIDRQVRYTPFVNPDIP